MGDTGDDVRASLDRWLARWRHGIPILRGCNPAAVHGELLDYLAGLGRSVPGGAQRGATEHVEQQWSMGSAVLQEAGCTLLVIGQRYL